MDDAVLLSSLDSSKFPEMALRYFKRWPVMASFYAYGLLALLTLSPFGRPYLRARLEPVAAAEWLGAAALAAAIFALFALCWTRCSSSKLTFHEGILIVTASMSIGWFWTSLLVIVPVLLFTLGASFVFVLVGFATRDREFAPMRFHRLVTAVQRRRMRG